MDLERSFAVGSGERFIIEGDEYNCAYFDRGPKFLHYRPQAAILTSVEYDHADLYSRPEDLTAVYRQLVASLPTDGLLVAHGDSPEVRALGAEAPCPVIFYGFDDDNDVRPTAWTQEKGGTQCVLLDEAVGEVELKLSTAGRHNLLNALAVWAVARRDGLAGGDLVDAFAGFHGVRRRQEELGSGGGVTVVDDFAHHPTAVAETIPALAERYRGRRLVVVYEPRSLTAGRKMFFDAYREAFAGADAVYFAPVFHSGRLRAEEALDLDELVAALQHDGGACTRAASIDELSALVLADLVPGDVVVTMSSGSFEGLPHRLLADLRGRRS